MFFRDKGKELIRSLVLHAIRAQAVTTVQPTLFTIEFRGSFEFIQKDLGRIFASNQGIQDTSFAIVCIGTGVQDLIRNGWKRRFRCQVVRIFTAVDLIKVIIGIVVRKNGFGLVVDTPAHTVSICSLSLESSVGNGNGFAIPFEPVIISVSVGITHEAN